MAADYRRPHPSSSKGFADLDLAGFRQFHIRFVGAKRCRPAGLLDNPAPRVTAGSLKFGHDCSGEWIGLGFLDAIRCQSRSNTRRCFRRRVLARRTAGDPTAPGKADDGHG